MSIHDCKHEADIAALGKDIQYIKEAVDNIRSNHLAHIYAKLENFVPQWVTVLMPILSALIAGMAIWVIRGKGGV